MKPSNTCHCISLRRASNKITSFYNKKLEPSQLTGAQHSLLTNIKKYEPVNVSILAEEIDLERTTLVRNLKLLEERGLICDVAKRGRGRQLQLTDDGKIIQSQAHELWKNAQSELENHLGKERLCVLSEILEILSKMDE